MNIEHKKTTLGDDSVLYQKRDDSLGKKDISNLSKVEKLAYFKDYYLKFVIIAGIILAFVVHLIYSTTFGRSVSLASLIFVNESYTYNPDALGTELKSYLGSDRKNDYVGVSNYNLDNYQENMAFVTQTATGTVDLVFCPQDYFEEACNRGTFMDLSQYLPTEMYDALKEQLLDGSYANLNEEGEVLSYEEPLPYGISLKDTAKYTEFGGADPNSILCVMTNSENKANTLRVISWFMDVPVPAYALEAEPAE